MNQLFEPKQFLSRFTTWRVGGIADFLCQPRTEEELIEALRRCDPEKPITWLGLGSNVLIRDGGIRGTTILTHHALNYITMSDESSVVEVGAGIACPKVAKWTAKNGMTGAEFLSGIPGSIGGALFMNAGAFGGEIWPIVDSVDVVTRKGMVERIPANMFRWSYRSLDVKPDFEFWFLRAQLRLAPTSEDGVAQRNIKALLAKRNETQPIGLASCGSVFKNPKGDFAARLIESAGLKGLRVGDAEVSKKHANFIINTGDAPASDIEELMRKIQGKVYESTGIMLEPEVRIIGEYR